MDRHEAALLLKELIALNIAQPYSVSLNQNKQGTFALILYSNCETAALRKFVEEKGLRIEENKEKEQENYTTKRTVSLHSPILMKLEQLHQTQHRQTYSS